MPFLRAGIVQRAPNQDVLYLYHMSEQGEIWMDILPFSWLAYNLLYSKDTK